MEQQLARIEGLRREREALQFKCDEIQIQYDKRHEELRRYALRKAVAGRAGRSQFEIDREEEGKMSLF